MLALFSIPWFLAQYLLLIPVLIVLIFVGIAGFVVAWIAQWAILFTGYYQRGMHDFVAGTLRWNLRSQAYLFGLTDRYPPFSTRN